MAGLFSLLCCGRAREEEVAVQGSRPKRRRRRRQKHIHASAAGPPGVNTGRIGSQQWDASSPISPVSVQSSTLSDVDYHDALSEFETYSEDGSAASPVARHTQSEQPGGLLDRITTWWEQHKHTNEADAEQQQQNGRPGLHPPRPTSLSPTTSLEPQRAVVEKDDEAKLGCVGLFTATQAVLSQRRFSSKGFRPLAGSSFSRRSEVFEESQASCAWEPADSTTFMIRSEQYMKTKVKVNSTSSIYRLIGVDLYSFDSKLFHVAQHIELPKLPQLGPAALAAPPDQQLPPLLIFNLQLPTYPPNLFGTNDGPGHSLIYYFGLPEGWEPQQVENQAALQLVQRFVHNKREHDGQPTRDRLKLIPRIVNVAEWAEKGPLTSYEHKLLINYNDKPLLTRPQQRFYHGQGYLEVDLDIHNYAYIARRAFHGFLGRLAPVVFENAFVVQGNRPEELPEVVLGCARVYRVDFLKSRPFPSESVERLGNGEGPPQDPDPAKK